MSIADALLITSPLWAVLVVGSLWADRRYIRAWFAWRLSRPILGDVDYPLFKKKLALWQARRPSRKDFRQTA